MPMPSTRRGPPWGTPNKYVSGTYLGQPVRWDGSGTAATELDNLGVSGSGATNALAFAVNEAGTAVGRSEKYVSGTNLGYRAVRWDGSGTAATELDNLGVNGSGSTAPSLCRQRGGDRRGILPKVRQRHYQGRSRGAVGRQWHRCHGTGQSRRGRLGHYYRLAFAVNEAGTAVGYLQKYVSGSSQGDPRCSGSPTPRPSTSMTWG